MSVQQQSVQDFHLVIVDDGSTDNTRSIVLELKDPRITYLYQENLGVCTARNRGAEATNSDFVTFLDSDDEVGVCWLEILLAKQAQEDSDVVSAGLKIYDHGREEGRRLPGPMEFFPEIIAAFTNSGTYIMRLSLFQRLGGFAEDCRSSEHTELGLRVAKISRSESVKFSVVDDCLLCYSRSTNASLSKNWLALAQGQDYLLKEHSDLYSLYRKVRAKAEYRLGYRQMRCGNLKAARKSFFKSLRSRPSLLVVLRLLVPIRLQEWHWRNHR